MRTARAPFPVHEAAKIIGGKLLTIHEYRCLTHRTHNEADCGCRPSYKLWRTPPRRVKR